MHDRRTLPAAAALVIAMLAAGCNPGHSVGEIPEPDTPTPDETPIIEPVTPPAGDLEVPGGPYGDGTDEG